MEINYTGRNVCLASLGNYVEVNVIMSPDENFFGYPYCDVLNFGSDF